MESKISDEQRAVVIREESCFESFFDNSLEPKRPQVCFFSKTLSCVMKSRESKSNDLPNLTCQRRKPINWNLWDLTPCLDCSSEHACSSKQSAGTPFESQGSARPNGSSRNDVTVIFFTKGERSKGGEMSLPDLCPDRWGNTCPIDRTSFVFVIPGIPHRRTKDLNFLMMITTCHME